MKPNEAQFIGLFCSIFSIGLFFLDIISKEILGCMLVGISGLTLFYVIVNSIIDYFS